MSIWIQKYVLDHQEAYFWSVNMAESFRVMVESAVEWKRSSILDAFCWITSKLINPMWIPILGLRISGYNSKFLDLLYSQLKFS